MREDRSQNMQQIAGQLPQLKVTAPPEPWVWGQTYAVGGLREVGFAPGSDLLLIVSTQGRSVLKLLTGERLARDYDDSLDWLDEQELLAQGIGPLAGQQIRIAGLSGGGLPSGTTDGWTIETETFHWPDRSVILKRPDWYIFETASQGCTNLMMESELRAVGFSPTGRSLVIATSSEVMLFVRPAQADLSAVFGALASVGNDVLPEGGEQGVQEERELFRQLSC